MNRTPRRETLNVVTGEGHLFGETLSAALHLAIGTHSITLPFIC